MSVCTGGARVNDTMSLSEQDDGAQQPEATATADAAGMWKRKLAPYLLVAPAVLFLGFFFAWPMVEGLKLAVFDDDALLPLLSEADIDAGSAGQLPQGTEVQILGQQGNLLETADESALLTEIWYQVSVEQPDGSTVQRWAPETRIRVRDTADDGTALAGTIRPKLAAGADPLTALRDAPSERADVVASVEPRAEADVVESAVLEVWFNLRGEGDDGAVEGWAPSRFVQVFGEGETGRIDRGSEGMFTTEFLEKMVEDRFFGPAWRTTLLLMALILPVQFVLAMLMALVIHARLKLTSGFLYVFTIPMGMSDLAVGIIFFSIFTGNGLLNSFLQGIGLIDSPQAWLTAETRGWIIFAIVLAEVWRATSIVMVIIVSGLQSIPDEMLEAAELFGAKYWRRVRYVMLPLLKPSLQVALILRTILALQVFGVVIALSGGDAVTVLARESFRQYFAFRNNNVASPYALFILLLSLASAFFYVRAVRTETAEVRK